MKPWPNSPSYEVIHLWMCRDLLSPRVDEALELLAPEEQERALGFRFEDDRRRYLGGALLQRTVLGHCLSRPSLALSFIRNEWGKPSLNQGDDSAIRFNSSRSHEVAILAVGAESEVGVDVEYERDLDLSMRCQFSKAERGFIENAPSSTQAFFEIWARKEAYIKGIGRGLSHPLDQFDVSPSGEGFVHDWSEDSPSESWSVRSVELPITGYAAAIAAPYQFLRFEIIEVSFDELLASFA
ncbi:MAG: 4'-phosphopantetheinyl transferase family protein [Verrucomicrobiales bacterium]|jgi:4'-phosphopantetheinyl transferase